MRLGFWASRMGMGMAAIMADKSCWVMSWSASWVATTWSSSLRRCVEVVASMTGVPLGGCGCVTDVLCGAEVAHGETLHRIIFLYIMEMSWMPCMCMILLATST